MSNDTPAKETDEQPFDINDEHDADDDGDGDEGRGDPSGSPFDINENSVDDA